MSRKRTTPMLWPSEVYDYERKLITDAAVGGLDLRRGAWLHCKWCNSTLKMATCFSLTSWKTHGRVKAHLNHEQEFLQNGSQRQCISASSQSSAHSPASCFQDAPRSVVTNQLSQDRESFVVFRRDLHLNQQHQARYQRDVSNVVNAMTSLITDQQSDLETLQHKVCGMTREILVLQKDVERLRRKDEQKVVQAPPKKAAATTPYTSRRKPTNHKFSVKVHNNGSYKQKTKTSTDMDLFEKRFGLG